MDKSERPEPSIRLEKARIARGFKTAKDAATYFNWNYTTYSQHERGERGITTKAAVVYSRALRCTRAYILTGEGPDPSSAPVVGYVGAADGNVTFDTPLPGDETVSKPPDAPPETVAVKVRGDSLGPGFNGWYALYADRRDPFTEDLINQLCVVGTEDERTLIKWVRQGPRKGRYTLVSGTGAMEDGVKLAWGARVLHLQPA